MWPIYYAQLSAAWRLVFRCKITSRCDSPFSGLFLLLYLRDIYALQFSHFLITSKVQKSICYPVAKTSFGHLIARYMLFYFDVVWHCTKHMKNVRSYIMHEIPFRVKLEMTNWLLTSFNDRLTKFSKAKI